MATLSGNRNRLGPDPEPLGVRFDVIMERLEPTGRPAPEKPAGALRPGARFRTGRRPRRVPVG